jgi:hypothetical protein
VAHGIIELTAAQTQIGSHLMRQRLPHLELAGDFSVNGFVLAFITASLYSTHLLISTPIRPSIHPLIHVPNDSLKYQLMNDDGWMTNSYEPESARVRRAESLSAERAQYPHHPPYSSYERARATDLHRTRDRTRELAATTRYLPYHVSIHHIHHT